MRSRIRRPSRLSEVSASCLIAVLALPSASARVEDTKIEPRVVELPPGLDAALWVAFVIAREAAGCLGAGPGALAAAERR